ncbi:Phosphoadenosine phosphosulfate reductase family [Musa troglodytarum]|uniref:FAD synthase n=1 Tax=Musa troglodytarum TaxID=320322 RepID=A0A9E7EYU1_9LILI|nr:Phosphoadenosine phosphosulfate reductase family [Musa troglodytarum]
MEIDRAVGESSDRRLQTKYRNAVYVIQRAFALYEFEQVAFSFNGGKDSTVLLHLLRAGYYLHKGKSECFQGNLSDSMLNCPIRTIYFESPSAFPEINSFTYETATVYNLQLETIRLDFKSGLEALLREKPTKAIFLGTRIGDPNAVGQEQFSPSSIGWPPFMRVNPILDWSYRDVWAFILTCKVKYCSLYDQGYTSIGSIYDTVPNALLSIVDSSSTTEIFKPAYMLSDGRSERAGRMKKLPLKCDTACLNNGVTNVSQSGSFIASIIVVGDEILFGTAEDKLSAVLCKKLNAIGWQVTRMTVVQNDIDCVAAQVEQQKSTNYMVFLLGGLGPMHSDVSLAGVAKAFGVRLAPDEEFEEYLRLLIGKHCTGDRNEMALLPEGITELMQHSKLPVPLIKCQNVIILAATNVSELETQWDCLLETPSHPLMRLPPFMSKHLGTMLSDVETAQTISKLCLEFPDIYIGCQRKSRVGPLVITFVGKDKTRIELAAEKLSNSFPAGAFSGGDCG